MWTIIKVDLKNLEFLKKEAQKKIGTTSRFIHQNF